MDGGIKILLPDLELHGSLRVARDKLLSWARVMVQEVWEKGLPPEQMVSELQQAHESCDFFVGHAGRKQPRPKEGQTCSEAQTCCDQRGDDGGGI